MADWLVAHLADNSVDWKVAWTAELLVDTMVQ
jgi:hypothetical protein